MSNAKWNEALTQRYELLEDARQLLKKEFFGIDGVIDQVIDMCSAWYLFPDVQEKPVIVNLWGLTGVGKSSLVRRLAQLLDYERRFYQVDLAGKRNSSVEDKLEEIYEYDNGFPIILALDEFQYARTLDEGGAEIKNDYSRIIWELLDSGKFMIRRYFDDQNELLELKDFLRMISRKGIRSENGIVIDQLKLFKEKVEKLSHAYYDDDDIPYLVPENYRDFLYNGTKSFFEDREAFEDYLNSLNAVQLMDYIDDLLLFVGSDKEIDCSKSLIFVLGNLDEAYQMSHIFSPDIDADTFHKESLKITVPKIKKALKRRLRNEQIARLGNTHIIYPALNQKAYQQIVAKELDAIDKRFA